MPGRIIYAVWGSTWETPGVIAVASLGAISGVQVGTWLTILTLCVALLYFMARMIWRTATERQQVMGELKEIGSDIKHNKKSLGEQTKTLDAIKECQVEQGKDVVNLQTRMIGAEARLEKLED